MGGSWHPGGSVALAGLLLPTLLTLLVALGACASSAATSSATSAPAGLGGPGALTGGGWAGDVCGLLSSEEILATTGLDVAVGRNSAPGQRDCVWYSDRGAVTVTALGGASAFDGPRADHVASSLTGLGDAAYWVGASGLLVVQSRGVVLAVNVDVGDIRISYADARELTALILPRL